MNNFLLKLKKGFSFLGLRKDDFLFLEINEKVLKKVLITINMKRKKMLNFSEIDLILKNSELLDIELFVKKKLENYKRLKKKSLEIKIIFKDKKFLKEFDLLKLRNFDQNENEGFKSVFREMKIKKIFRRRKKIKKK